jgi:protocatechuate 3,4-dioxygenase alpha subunit
MSQKAKLRQTPSQTVGPYFAYCLTPGQYGYDFSDLATGLVAGSDVDGEHVRIEGRVIDGAGNPVNDAMIEIWQADAQGRYAHPADPRGSNASFRGFGRCGTGTDRENRYIFETVKPGRVDTHQAPHLNVILTMRGMLAHAFTRIYFSDEAAANSADPVLLSVPADRRQTLIAERTITPTGIVYRFDFHMQGPRETAFFDV